MAITKYGDISLVIYNDGFCAIKNANDKEVQVEKYVKENCKVKTNLATYITEKNISGNTEGLFTDDYENIRYRGSNREVKNYVTFNNETWRIIGIFDGRVKMIRNESVGNMKWNEALNNNWNISTLKTYLNGEYYNKLSNQAKSQIDSTSYHLGGDTTTVGMYANTMYEKERGMTVYPGNPISTQQTVGLMYPSDYGYAAHSNCSEELAHYDQDINCSKEGNWLFLLNTFQWLITPRSDTASYAFYVYNTGLVAGGNGVEGKCAVRPVVYLKTSAAITNGAGTSSNPYIIG